MSHTNPAPRRTWPWVVAVLVIVAAIIVGASLISSMLADPSAQSTPTATPRAVVSSSTPSATPSPTGTSLGASRTTLSKKNVATIEGAIDDSDATELYAFLSKPVHVEFAASDFDSDRSPDNAVIDLDYIKDSSGWNWALDEPTLASFRAGAYGSSFPKGAIIGESAEGYVISFTITKAKITAIFVSKSVSLVTAPAP